MISTNEICNKLRRYSCIPKEKLRYITCLDAGAFAGHNDLEYIELPDVLQNIGCEAFRDCYNLKKINIKKTLKQFKSK